MSKHLVFSVALVLLIWGCAATNPQRTGYEVLKNIERQRCEESDPRACTEQPEYAEYQRSRGIKR